jgi:hypothetical protein
MSIQAFVLAKTLRQRFRLIDYILSQNDVQFVKRPVDMRWYYNNVVPISVVGFNPLHRTIFYGTNSFLEIILNSPLNCTIDSIEWCLYELFFAAHDYMHIWAVDRLLSFFPNCTKEGLWKDETALSDLAFVLILSEAVATVSIDYWLLSEIDMAKELGIETRFKGLTTPFRADHLAAAQRLCNGFNVRDHSFFIWLVQAYCSGVITGFDINSTNLPEELSWIKTEQKQSVRQLTLIHDWLRYLSARNRTAPCFCGLQFDAGLRAEVIRDLSREVWDVCHRGRLPRLSPPDDGIRVPFPAALPIYDFRFNNIRAFEDLNRCVSMRNVTGEQFHYLVAQFVSSFEYSETYQVTPDRFDSLLRAENWRAVTHLFGRARQLNDDSGLGMHIFLPN